MVEEKIITQHCSQSTLVPFKNKVSQRPTIIPAKRNSPIKHFSEAKMRTCREKGIFYNCDEKFTRGHRYAEKKLYLLDVDSLSAPKISNDVEDPVDDKDDI